MLKKVYVEITNVCNLHCGFCRGTSRPPRFMPPEEFAVLAAKLRPYTEYIYLHLLGEPLLHPRLGEILAVCRAHGYKVTVVTNGTRITDAAETLLNCGCLYKMGWSLHAYEANALPCTPEEYLAPILAFAERSAAAGVINVFKLWNGGAENRYNERLIQAVCGHFGSPRRRIPTALPWASGCTSTLRTGSRGRT